MELFRLAKLSGLGDPLERLSAGVDFEIFREVLTEKLEEDPEKHGYNCITWTGPMLIDWIEKEYGIIYKKAQIYNIIKTLGFSYQKGRGLFPETSSEKQEAFKEALKKTARRKR